MADTDPAVQAAWDAVKTWQIDRTDTRANVWEVAVAAARPIIEAEVRERIAAEIEAGCLAAGDGPREGRARTDLCAPCRASARVARGQS